MASESSKGMEQWELIADTSSLEEDLGPMQLHAAGTASGFTALQLVCNRAGSLPPLRRLSRLSHWAQMQASCCSILRNTKQKQCQPSVQYPYLQHPESLLRTINIVRDG